MLRDDDPGVRLSRETFKRQRSPGGNFKQRWLRWRRARRQAGLTPPSAFSFLLGRAELQLLRSGCFFQESLPSIRLLLLPRCFRRCLKPGCFLLGRVELQLLRSGCFFQPEVLESLLSIHRLLLPRCLRRCLKPGCFLLGRELQLLRSGCFYQESVPSIRKG